jgi:integrase
MARVVRNPKLDSREARSKLPVRREPHWVKLGSGRALGYRKTATGRGFWIAKHRDKASSNRRHESLGAADDAMDADGLEIFSYEQACKLAYAFFEKVARRAAGLENADHAQPQTVGEALESYFADREGRGSKSVAKERAAMAVHVPESLSCTSLDRLSKHQLKAWLRGMAAKPAMHRGARAAEPVFLARPLDDEGIRKRRASANRYWTILRGALNFVAKEWSVSDAAWKGIETFKEVDVANVRYLSRDEVLRLTRACPPDLKALVTAAVLTGCRYQELARLRVEDIDLNAGVATVRKAKNRRSRHAVLTAEAQQLLAQLRLGRGPKDLVLTRADGEPWRKSDQQRPLALACTAAKVDINFHGLRHTCGALLAMEGTPMSVISHQLGHRTVAITEKYYAHLSPSYVSDTIRQSLGTLGVLEPTNVEILKPNSA